MEMDEKNPRPYPGLNIMQVYIVEEQIKEEFPFARPLAKIVKENGAYALPILGFMDQLANAHNAGEVDETAIIGTLPIMDLPLDKTSGTYYPPEPGLAMLLMPELNVRDTLIQTLKPSSSPNVCLDLDTSKLAVNGRNHAEHYAWGTQYSNLYLLQVIEPVNDLGDKTVSEYLVHLPKEVRNECAKEIEPPIPSPYGQNTYLAPPIN